MRNWLVMVALVLGACGGNAADRLGIGAECSASDPCPEDGDEQLACLTEFAGGYCGRKDCASNDDCVEGSICVTQGGANFCFRTCTDKPECNANRSAANESNCSSNIVRVDGGSEKACVPPSSGS